MNYKMIVESLGRVCTLLPAFLLIPLITCIVYGEDIVPFAITIVVSFAVGVILRYLARNSSGLITSADGGAIVVFSWILASLIGMIPYIIGGAIPDPVDAFFETVSGLTTTGATILTDIESLPHGMLMWRALTHWIGGMGIIVFIMAIATRTLDRSVNILSSEMPGSGVSKIRPRAKETAKALYIMYIGMTAVLAIILVIEGMSPFDSIAHAFSTAGTGGFSTRNNSLGAFNDVIRWTITIFMILFGINFNLYYGLINGKVKDFFRNTELKVYLAVILISTIIVTIIIYVHDNPLYYRDTIYGYFKDAAFQVASIITTAGFSSVNFDLWHNDAKNVLMLLMFFGGCAGSTAGGLKIIRLVVLFKAARNDIRKRLNPRRVYSVRIDGKVLDKNQVSSIKSYFFIYITAMVILYMLISFEPFSMEACFSATVACINNVGPGFEEVGPLGTFAGFTPFSKLVMSTAMLFGRLEIYPFIIMFMKKK